MSESPEEHNPYQASQEVARSESLTSPRLFALLGMGFLLVLASLCAFLATAMFVGLTVT